MAFLFRVVGLILVVTSMETMSVRAWDLWDLGPWSSAENDSGPWDGLSGIDEVPENQKTSDYDPLSGAPYEQGTAGGFDDQNNTSNGFAVVPSNGSFPIDDEGASEKKEDDESKGFAHQLLQKTMDFLSRLLSPSQSSRGKSNSTEADDIQPRRNESDICREDGTSANCSSDSVTQDQPLQDKELQELEGEYPFVASTVPPLPFPASDFPDLSPTWIDASEPCLRESIGKSVGNCNWEEAKLEDAVLAVFNDTVIRRLAKKCTPGEWCLRKHFSKHVAHAAQRYCHLLSCLEDWKDNYCRPVSVIWNSLDLLCALTTANTSDTCVISVLKMTHVTITDMIRVTIQPEDAELLCSKDEDKKDCTGPCQKAGQNLHCMSTSCDNNTDLFEGFAEWQWMFAKSDVMEKCQLNSSDCRLFETNFPMTSSDTAMMPHHSYRRILTILKDNEWSVVAGISLSVLFSLLVICGIFLGLRCSGRRRLRKRLLRQKNMGRDDAGFTRDRIQYTIINTQQDDFYDQDSDEMT